MPFVGFVIAMIMFFKFKRHWGHGRWDERLGREWRRDRERERKHERRLERERRRSRRHGHGWGCGFPGVDLGEPDDDTEPPPSDGATPRDGVSEQDRGAPRDSDRPRSSKAADAQRPPSTEDEARRRARRRATAEAAFYGHLLTYLAVIALLAFINLMTGGGPWFLWPAFGWGIGIFSHFMSLFGSRLVRERFFEPALERELRRERVVMQTEKQASIDELSSTIAHEIRNPIAAAKSLVQQMGEDPHSVENVEYAKVALEELDRVERRISHLLKYAKEEDYEMALVNVATVVDSACTQMRAKLDAAKVAGHPQLHRRADGRGRRREAPSGLRQHRRQRDRRARRAIDAEGRPARALHRERRREQRPYACATTAAASRPTSSTTSSIPSSAPRRPAPGSEWRSRRRSSRPTRARST